MNLRTAFLDKELGLFVIDVDCDPLDRPGVVSDHDPLVEERNYYQLGVRLSLKSWRAIADQNSSSPSTVDHQLSPQQRTFAQSSGINTLSSGTAQV